MRTPVVVSPCYLGSTHFDLSPMCRQVHCIQIPVHVSTYSRNSIGASQLYTNTPANSLESRRHPALLPILRRSDNQSGIRQNGGLESRSGQRAAARF